MSETDDITREFVVESNEGLDRVEQEIVALERRPGDREIVQSIFRTLHSIKGVSGFLGFSKLEAVAHAGENLLVGLREGEVLLTAEITGVLLQLVDAVRNMLSSVEAEGVDGEGSHDELIETLSRLRGVDVGGAATAGSEEVSTDGEEAAVLSEASQSTVRVDTAVLDKLMNVVGELVLTRNQVLQLTSDSKDRALLGTAQRLDLITTELQGGIMKTRMQPIRNVWNRFPRLCRDVAMQCEKQVSLEMEGSNTEMDRTIIESVRDPLTHLVRNAIDHGIESPADREASGKPAQGSILLRAYHEGGQVNIEVRDDGAGIDLEGVRRRAQEQGLLGKDGADRAAESDLQRLLFLPGFTTTEEVSNISGRGVGMDVVRTNIEKLGGTVDLQSQVGEGTLVKIKIPLTLATIPTLVVMCAGDSYAIPQVNLLECVRLESDATGAGIEEIRGTPVYRLRGQLLPLVFLRRELGVEEEAEAAETTEAADVVIVVLETDERQFGLVVDRVGDSQEIVVKPLGKLLQAIPTYAGATIMGNGEVALILDVLSLAQRTHVISDERTDRSLQKDTEVAETQELDQSLVVFRIREEGQMAIPLSLVTRLERIRSSTIERSGDQEVFQYRGQLMPLVRLGHLLGLDGESSEAASEVCDVIVHSDGEQTLGLVVGEIVDILHESITLEARDDVPGLLGSAVLSGRVTDILDLGTVIRLAAPPFFAGVDADPEPRPAADAETEGETFDATPAQESLTDG